MMAISLQRLINLMKVGNTCWTNTSRCPRRDTKRAHHRH